jgi:hypothetical protein
MRRRQIKAFNDRRIYNGKPAPTYYQKMALKNIAHFRNTFKRRMKFRKVKRAPYHQKQRHAHWRPKRTRVQRGFTPFQVKFNY